MDAAERALQWAAEIFDQFDGDLDTADPQSVFTTLAEVAQRRLDAADAASVTTYDGTRFATVAATHESASRLDRLQFDRGSGPSMAAIVDEPLCHVPDLRRDDRWPVEARADAAALGFTGVLSVRLATTRDATGVTTGDSARDATGDNARDTPGQPAAALNLYSARPDAFDAKAVRMATLLAAHARMALLAADSEARALNLERSRRTNEQIGVAVGVLMANRALAHDEAMNLLRTTSQRTNTRVSDLAADVIATGVLPRMKNRAPRRKPG